MSAMKRAASGCALWLVLFLCPRVQALPPWEYAVQLEADVQASPPRIVLSWDASPVARAYEVYRRGTASSDWGQPVSTLPGSATGYTDESVSTGVGYEYQVIRETTVPPWPEGDPAQWHRAYGYLSSGIDVPLVDAHGALLLVVDNRFSEPLAAELGRLRQDLAGDGWVVIQRDASWQESPAAIRSLIQQEYQARPSELRSVFLFGHIPVPYSGNIAPDFHEDHRGAWPADLYYGEITGSWTDDTVQELSSHYPDNHNVPGDGKFDASQPPAQVQLEVGRVDLWNLPAFEKTETELLRQYLNKNHDYRHSRMEMPRRGLIRDEFGEISGDAPAATAWRNFSVLFGRAQIREVGFEQFFPTLRNEKFLWAYAGGGGSFDHADGVGNTADFAQQDPQAVFYYLQGSYFGDWNTADNFLRAPLATSSFGLASVWGGLPHWFDHPLAMGRTIGFTTRLVQNNGNGEYKNRINPGAGLVHTALMGDPTLRLHPVTPPSQLSATVGSDVVLSWAPSPEVSGYLVYRSETPLGPYARLTSGVIPDLTFRDASAWSGQVTYMVRGVKREATPSGSYFNASQGIFVTAVSQVASGRLTGVRTGDGQLLLRYEGVPHTAHRIEASLDLVQWAELAVEESDADGVLELIESAVGQARFYRVMASE